MPDDEFLTEEQCRELFREWKEDYSLRRDEDAQRRLAMPEHPPALPPHPWPSEIAKEHRQAQPDQRPLEPTTGKDGGHSL